MDSVIDIFSIIAKAFAAINIIAATYFHYRYVIGPSSSRNFRDAQLHWCLSGFFVAVAALTDSTLSTAPTVVITIGALIGPVVPLIHLRKIRTERTPTFLDEIAMDDIIDRARNGHERD